MAKKRTLNTTEERKTKMSIGKLIKNKLLETKKKFEEAETPDDKKASLRETSTFLEGVRAASEATSPETFDSEILPKFEAANKFLDLLYDMGAVLADLED